MVARTHLFDRAAGTVHPAISRSSLVLDHLADVGLVGAQDKQILRYDAATEQWQNSNERTDADTVDGFHASAAVAANKLLPLDGSAQLPASVTGNAATATRLQTVRKVNGVNFDGTADITVTANPNTHTHAGTDVTTAVASATNADTVDGIHAATTAAANKLLALDAASKLPASITGNAASATALATARTINGVSFDGSANITVTAAPNAHTHVGTDVTSAVASATNADTVDGIHASTTAAANKLLALDASSLLPTSVTGNAATATKLATVRRINNVNFDGTADITVNATPNPHTHVGTDVTSAVASATNADTVDNIHAATATPAANKLLALDANSKLPASITGDAVTVGGFTPSATPGASAIPVTNANGRLAGALIEATRPGATFIVAASNSRNKNQADYVCTGVSDGTIIQSAVDAAFALGGGTVLLLEGTFSLGSGQQIEMKSNVHLRGMGKGATVLTDSGAPTINLNAALVADVIRNVKISDLELTTAAAVTYGSVAMVGAGRVEDVWLDNLKITNSSINSSSVYHNCTGGSKRIKVTGCESYTPASGAYGLLFWGKVDGLWLEDNYVEITNAAGYNPIGIYGDCTHFSCCRNVVVTAGHSGIASSQSSYGVIAGNIVDATLVTSPEVEAGIEVEWKYGHGGTDTSHHIIVSGNIVYNGNIGILVTRRDTSAGYVSPYAVLLTGNLLEDCATGISLVYGDDVSVQGNLFRNCPIEVAYDRGNVTLEELKILGDLSLVSANRVVKTLCKTGLADNVATAVFKIHTTDRAWANGVFSCKVRGLVSSANALNAQNNAAKYGEWAFVKASSNDGVTSLVSAVTQVCLSGSASANVSQLDVGAVTVTLTNSGRDTTVNFMVDLNPNTFTKTVELVLTIELDYFMYQDPPVITAL